jgi:hypothetical protein
MRIDESIILKFLKLSQFSNKMIFTNMIVVGFHIQFSNFKFQNDEGMGHLVYGGSMIGDRRIKILRFQP